MERRVHSGCTDPTQATARLVIVSVSRIQTTEIHQSYGLCYHLTGSQVIPDETKTPHMIDCTLPRIAFANCRQCECVNVFL